jgi:cell shape-determining protein MreC
MSENDVLHRELERERLKVFRAEQIMDENRELKMLLGRSDETNYTLAYVLARPALTPYDTMLIDAGSSKGVSVGDLVFGEASVVIGEVRDVFPGNSRAVLFSSPGVETDVFLPDGGASGVARGRGHGNFVMRLPQDIAVGEGDAIMMPGDAMLLGFVSAVERLVGDVFQTVRFRTLVNVSTLTRVFVASPPGTR